MPGDLTSAVAEFVAARQTSRAGDVATTLSISGSAARVYLGRLADAGTIRRLARGVYGPVKSGCNIGDEEAPHLSVAPSPDADAERNSPDAHSPDATAEHNSSSEAPPANAAGPRLAAAGNATGASPPQLHVVCGQCGLLQLRPGGTWAVASNAATTCAGSRGGERYID